MDAPDQQDRDQARLRLESSVIVEAGAGTGKTTLLTDRILFLVLAGNKPSRIEEIVALTFTEKSASDIKVRLSERLAELAARLSTDELPAVATERVERTLNELRVRFQTPDAQILSRAHSALEDLDKAPIGTIHSFCSQLLRLYPVEAGVDPGFRVDEGRGFAELFSAEWARWLDDELGELPPRRESWLALLKVVSIEDMESLAREICAERFDAESLGAADPKSAIALRALAATATKLGDGRAKPRGGIMEALAAIEKRLSATAVAAESEYPALDALEPPAPSGSKWPKAWEDDASAAEFYEQLCLIAKIASPRGEAATRRAAQLLAPFAACLRNEYARRGWVSFDGLLRRARDLVRDAARPREELKRRFSAILVDEFQDTDPLQGELLLYLSESCGRSASAWRDVVPAPGRLFVVGDPKQSIYRFRGADIAAYEGFLSRLRANGALTCNLTANFRSAPGIVGAVNNVFSRMMRAESGVQPSYKGLLPAQPGNKDEVNVEVVAVIDPSDTADAASCQRTEAAWVAGRILSESSRPLKDFAVLVRSSSALPAFIDAFKRAGIAYSVEIERHFYEAPEVGDLLNLLRALDDPNDRIAVTGLLRSPLAVLSDDGLLSLARADAIDYRKDIPLRTLPEDERLAATRLFETLRTLRARAGRVPLGELVTDALVLTRLPELSARAYHGQQTVSNLLKLQRLAVAASESWGSTLKDFVAEVAESSRQERREGESPLADEHLEAVRIMSIHKSKGLEFPIVFVANLSARTATGTPPAARLDWTTGRTALRIGKLSSAAAALANAREKLLERRESVRLLYVAMTRAKERLYLLGREKADSGSLAAHLDKEEAWPRAGIAGSLPALFIEAGKLKEYIAAPAFRRALSAEAATTMRAWEKRARHRVGTDQPQARAATDYLRDAPQRPALSGGSAQGAQIGQLCHLVLQGWDFSTQKSPAPACAAARTLLERRAPGPCWDQSECAALSALGIFLSSPAAGELSAAAILGREVPFAYAAGNTVVRGAVDLVYRLGGRLVIADFKSEHVDEKSAAEIRVKYAEQGRAYIEALRLAWGECAEFRIFFLRRPDL